MRRFALIGCGISKSLSPGLFADAYPGYEYNLIDTPDFEEALQRASLLGCEAVNITSPFKEKAFAAAHWTDEVSQRIGAVNILVLRNGRIEGYNSDYSAVRALLRRASGTSFPAEGGAGVLVVGCGGAGKAAAVAASDEGCRTFVANRTYGRAEAFCRHSGAGEAVPLESIAPLLKSVSAVIYTLPLRIPSAGLICAADNVIKIEASYTNPSLCGEIYYDGLQWLALQAQAGYRTMTGEEPSAEAFKSFPIQKLTDLWI